MLNKIKSGKTKYKRKKNSIIKYAKK